MKVKNGLGITGSLSVSNLAGTGSRLALVDSAGTFSSLTNGSSGQFMRMAGATASWGSIANSDLPSVIDSNARVAIFGAGGPVGTRRGIRFLHSGLGTTTFSDDSINERVDVTVTIPASHAHAASDINTGNLDILRLPAGLTSVTTGDLAVGTGPQVWGRLPTNNTATLKFLRNSNSALLWDYPVQVLNSSGVLQGTVAQLQFIDTATVTWGFVGGTGVMSLFPLVTGVPSHQHSGSDITSGVISSARMPNVSGWSSQACTSSKTVACGLSATLGNLASVLSALINDLRTVGVLVT